MNKCSTDLPVGSSLYEQKVRLLPYMVAEPHGAAAGATTCTRRTRTRRNSKASYKWLVVPALLLLTALSASRVFVEAVALGKPQDKKVRFKRRGTHHKLKVDGVDLRKQIRLVEEPGIHWKSEIFIEEDSYKVEVHCPLRWRLQDIQVKPSPIPKSQDRGSQEGSEKQPEGVREETKFSSRSLGEEILCSLKEIGKKLKSVIMTEAAFRSIQESLQNLVSVQRNSQWGKHLKTPEVFKPSTREDEIKQWQDWKFGFMNYLSAIDAEVFSLVQEINNDPKGDYSFEEMTDGAKQASVRFYGMLVSYMKGRPLQVIRHIQGQNGFVAWATLLREMEPSTRQRGLALLTQLSRVTFFFFALARRQYVLCHASGLATVSAGRLEDDSPPVYRSTYRKSNLTINQVDPKSKNVNGPLGSWKQQLAHYE